MSRRYGRNQKRHARERIAQLTAAHSMEAGMRSHLARSLGEARAEIEEAARVLGETNSALSPRHVAIGGSPLPVVHMALFPPVEVLHGTDGPVDTFRQVPLHVLLGRVEWDRIGDRVHAIFQFSGARAGYAATEATIRSTPRDILIKHMARSIAEQLERELVGIGKRVGRAD